MSSMNGMGGGNQIQSAAQLNGMTPIGGRIGTMPMPRTMGQGMASPSIPLVMPSVGPSLNFTGAYGQGNGGNGYNPGNPPPFLNTGNGSPLGNLIQKMNLPNGNGGMSQIGPSMGFMNRYINPNGGINMSGNPRSYMMPSFQRMNPGMMNRPQMGVGNQGGQGNNQGDNQNQMV